MAVTSKVDYTSKSYPGRVCNGISTSSTLTTGARKVYKNSTDSVNLDKKTENPFTGYLVYENMPVINVTFPCQDGSLWTQYIESSNGIDMETYFPYGHLSSNDDPSYGYATSAFYSRLSNLTVNMAQVFAERQMTVNLIANNAKRLAHMYLSLRRGRNPFTGGTCNSRNAAQLWLEYNYGWKPLIQDVYGAIDVLKGNLPELTVRVSPRGTFFQKLPDRITNTYLQGQSTRVTHSESICRGYSQTTVKASFTIKDPAVLTANAIGLTNPALIVWELIPYSFVVDWFLPIGSWLERQTAMLGLSLVKASTTRTTVRTWTSSTTVRVQTPSYTYVTASGEKTKESRYKSRVTSLPSTMALPRFKNPISTSHALSALALLRQVFK